MTIKTPCRSASRRPRLDSSIDECVAGRQLLTVAGAGWNSAAKKITDGTGGGGGHIGQTASGGAGAGVQGRAVTAAKQEVAVAGGVGPSVDVAADANKRSGRCRRHMPPLYTDAGWEDRVCSLFPSTVQEWGCDGYGRAPFDGRCTYT